MYLSPQGQFRLMASTANGKYSLLNRGNCLQHFQMQLYQKRKIFFAFFLHFLNLVSILNIFRKRDDPHSSCIFEFMDLEKCR